MTHDVKRFILDKPRDYRYIPGQATNVCLDLEGWRDKKHPFTFTGLNSDLILEFTIKGYPTKDYPDHEGMTEKLHKMKPGEALLLDNPWGTINYKGPGVFIAGGAGITPFIAIFRSLREKNQIKGNKLLFSNKKREDVILEKELRYTFDGESLLLTLTQENRQGYLNERIDEEFINKHIKNPDTNFYICGPDRMVADLTGILKGLGAASESIVFEE